MQFTRILNLLSSPKLIFDLEIKLGDFRKHKVSYKNNLLKEELSRQYIFKQKGRNLNFLEIGAAEGKLEYLLGTKRNLEYDSSFYRENLSRFTDKFSYFGLDIKPLSKNVIKADICDEDLMRKNKNFDSFFDVIYSNNVFEHLSNPFVAASNILKMLKKNGICITVAPFSLRYHESPSDYFRYTHRGLASLFNSSTKIKTFISGYDTSGRRNNWQGTGKSKDICPVDYFGAWRENWFTILIFKKLSV